MLGVFIGKTGEEMKRYKSIYTEEDATYGPCGRECAVCPDRFTCDKTIAEEIMKETCPEGSKPRNGKCAKADNSGYLAGKCDKGYALDRDGKSCVKHTD